MNLSAYHRGVTGAPGAHRDEPGFQVGTARREPFSRPLSPRAPQRRHRRVAERTTRSPATVWFSLEGRTLARHADAQQAGQRRYRERMAADHERSEWRRKQMAARARERRAAETRSSARPAWPSSGSSTPATAAQPGLAIHRWACPRVSFSGTSHALGDHWVMADASDDSADPPSDEGPSGDDAPQDEAPNEDAANARRTPPMPDVSPMRSAMAAAQAPLMRHAMESARQAAQSPAMREALARAAADTSSVSQAMRRFREDNDVIRRLAGDVNTSMLGEAAAALTERHPASPPAIRSGRQHMPDAPGEHAHEDGEWVVEGDDEGDDDTAEAHTIAVQAAVSEVVQQNAEHLSRYGDQVLALVEALREQTENQRRRADDAEKRERRTERRAGIALGVTILAALATIAGLVNALV